MKTVYHVAWRNNNGASPPIIRSHSKEFPNLKRAREELQHRLDLNKVYIGGAFNYGFELWRLDIETTWTNVEDAMDGIVPALLRFPAKPNRISIALQDKLEQDKNEYSKRKRTTKRQ